MFGQYMDHLTQGCAMIWFNKQTHAQQKTEQFCQFTANINRLNQNATKDSAVTDNRTKRGAQY